jgi:hypothetical protein
MTTTPNEPDHEPEVAPAGDPTTPPSEAPGSPADPEPPHGDPLVGPDDRDSEPGQMPETTNTEVGA